MTNLTVITNTALWQPDTLAAFIEAACEACCVHLGLHTRQEVAIVLSDDKQVQKLNRDFRGKDKPTNVLSFPSDAPGEWGDIIFAHETIAREAGEQDKSFHEHFCHLLVHGLLHLLGYDHIEQSDAEQMEALEVAILAKLSIANPYEKS